VSTTRESSAPDASEGAPGALPAECGDPGDPAEHRPGRFGWVFAGIWLFYLVEPLRTAWRSTSEPLAVRALAIAALLAFAAGFLWFFVAWRRRPHDQARIGRRPPARVVFTALGLGALLLVLAEPGAGEDVLAGFVYLGVTAAISLPLTRGLPVIALVVAASLLLPRTLPGWHPQDDFVPQLLLACFAAYGVGQVIVRNSQLARAREQLVDLAVTRERERVARDVHDILGHSLTVITVKAELAGRLLEGAPGTDRARSEVADVERLAREALADVRATVSGMREVSLTGELVTARRALEAAGISADLPTAVDVVPARHRQLFAWALREGVTNVVRHSGATACVVRLSGDCVEVRDDGHGGGGADGNGLAGLRARAAAARARVETGRAPEGGMLLRVVAGGRR
jgi:two-component system sensor histidine kinase DesK